MPQVWFWQHDRFTVYHLQSDQYEEGDRSHPLPNLDLALVANYVRYSEPLDAVLEFCAVLRQHE